METAYQPRALCRPANPKALFLPYQEKWIQDNARLKAMEKSRQIGISWSTAYRLVRQASLTSARLDFWVSSRDDIQARLFLEDCKAFAKLLNTAAKDLGQQLYQVANGKEFTSYDMRFANGITIHSMSSNPDAQAGKRGSRCLDEFALHPDPRKLYAIAYPGITWGGSLEIISTHRGSQNFFNRVIIEDARGKNKRGISLHTVTLQDALDQGFLFKLQCKLAEATDDDERLEMDEAEYFDFIRAGCPDDETFQQEYMCVPSDDATAFIPYDLIDANTYALGEDWETILEYGQHPLYIGVDIGRDHDLTVITILEKVGGVLFTRRMIELKNMPFSQQEAILYPYIAHHRTRRVCIDSTGIGRQFAERARQRFGSYKVEEVTFTPAVKEELAYPVKAALEDRNLRLPRDEKLTADFRGIRKETTAAGNIRFSGERSASGHCDRFWSFGLAVHAAKSAAGFGGLPQRHPQAINRTHSRLAARRNRACA